MAECRGKELRFSRQGAVGFIGWLGATMVSRNDFVARYLLVSPDDDLLVRRQLIGITRKMNLPNQEVDAWMLWIGGVGMREECAIQS
jgi:hypothetical protein